MAHRTPYAAMADLNLWYKQSDGDKYMLSDIPSIISLRWKVFKDTWEFIKEDLEKRTQESFDPDLLVQNIADMTNFIDSQRTSTSVVNPFALFRRLLQSCQLFLSLQSC